MGSYLYTPGVVVALPNPPNPLIVAVGVDPNPVVAGWAAPNTDGVPVLAPNAGLPAPNAEVVAPKPVVGVAVVVLPKPPKPPVAAGWVAPKPPSAAPGTLGPAFLLLRPSL